jgi:hypothetical protein
VGLGRIELPTSALSVGLMGTGADTDERSQQVTVFRDVQRTRPNRSARAINARWIRICSSPQQPIHAITLAR